MSFSRQYGKRASIRWPFESMIDVPIETQIVKNKATIEPSIRKNPAGIQSSPRPLPSFMYAPKKNCAKKAGNPATKTDLAVPDVVI